MGTGMGVIPLDYVDLTPKRKKLLELLSDGKWHRKFLGVSISTFDLMMELGFIRMRHIDKNPRKTNNWGVEARITQKGRFLLKNKTAHVMYEFNSKGSVVAKVIEMQK